jgi:hypothetical protein
LFLGNDLGRLKPNVIDESLAIQMALNSTHSTLQLSRVGTASAYATVNAYCLWAFRDRSPARFPTAKKNEL